MGKRRWDDKRSLEENVRKVVPRMARKWFAAGRKAMRDGTTWDEMHEFRLLTKRFRYTLEIFAPLFGPSLQARIRQLRRLQTHLGEINDRITAQGLLEGRAAPPLMSRLALEAERRTAELRRLWSRDFESEETETAWRGYLARYAGRRRGPQRRKG